MSPVDAPMSAPSQSREGPPQSVIIGLLVLIAVVLHVVFWQSIERPSERTLIGPDSYMRLVRVDQLMRTGDWRSQTIARSNAPYGEVQHWTRPFDALLIGLSVALRPITGAPDALYWAGVIVSPLLHILLCLTGAWAAAPLLGRQRLWMMPVLLAQWPIIAYVAPGRADHHGLIFLVFLLGVSGMLRLLTNPASRRWPAIAGAIHGFGLWITVVEFTVLLAVATVILSLRWALSRQHASEYARQGLSFAAAVALVAAVATAFDHPGLHVLTPSYDRISIVYLALTGVLAIAWSMFASFSDRSRYAASIWARSTLLAALGLSGIAAMVTMFPRFFLGPTADVDPAVLAILNDTIIEMQPLFPDTPGRLALSLRHMGAGLIGLPMLIWMLASPAEREWRPLWIYLAVGLAVTGALSLAFFRFSPFFALLIAFPLAAFIGIAFEAIGARLTSTTATLVRSTGVLFILMLPIGLESIVKHVWAEPSPRLAAANCPVEDILPTLTDADGPLAGPQILLSNSLGLAATLLYRTPHSVVAAPYFGNARGILDAHRVFTATYDPYAQAVVGQRGIDWIVICRSAGRSLWRATTTAGPTLHERLLTDDPPAWLDAVPLPAPADAHFALYRIKTGANR